MSGIQFTRYLAGVRRELSNLPLRTRSDEQLDTARELPNSAGQMKNAQKYSADSSLPSFSHGIYEVTDSLAEHRQPNPKRSRRCFGLSP
jgi:hypothetical protein